MSVSDYEIRKLDQKMGEAEDRDPNLKRCPTCECRLIIANQDKVFAKPTCPNCWWSE